MLNLRDVQGDSSRKELSLNFITEDQKDQWTVRIETGNLPTPFVNSSNERRRVSFSLIDGTDFKPSEHTNSMLIPLTLVAITNINDEIVCHYQQRYSPQVGDQLQATISTSITMKSDQTDRIENPSLLLELSVIPQEEMSRMQGNSDAFATGNRGAQFVRRDRNENSNGGLDIPVAEMNHLEPGDKLFTVSA